MNRSLRRHQVLQSLSAIVLTCIAAACTSGRAELALNVEAVAEFDEPWAMTFLPDGRMLVTEKRGRLFITSASGEKVEVTGVPEVAYGGQGGLGDVALHPDFRDNGLIYLSYAEAGADRTRGAAVARARLNATTAGASLRDVNVIWRQVPKVTGSGHYGHRLLFAPDGYLFISSGERQKFDPSQDMDSNLGKILRVNADGSLPGDNPFAKHGGVTAQIWSLGHRNPLGLAFDADGALWSVEMGPRGGDELNRIVRGANYGYPLVSNGRHYSGRDIPDHDTRPEFAAPAAWWTPVISPADMLIYSGSAFPEWRGDALIAGLGAQGLVRVELDGDTAREIERYPLGRRTRAVAQGPDGAVWVLEDGRGRLLRIVPDPDPS